MDGHKQKHNIPSTKIM